MARLQCAEWLPPFNGCALWQGNQVDKSGQEFWRQSSTLIHFKMLNRCNWDPLKVVIRQKSLHGGRANICACMGHTMEQALRVNAGRIFPRMGLLL